MQKVREILDANLYQDVISWSPNGKSIIIYNKEKLQKILPKFSKTSQYTSFLRRLHTHGFKRINDDPIEFAHPLFQRNNPHMFVNTFKRQSSDNHITYDETKNLDLNETFSELQKIHQKQQQMINELQILKNSYKIIQNNLDINDTTQNGRDHILQGIMSLLNK